MNHVEFISSIKEIIREEPNAYKAIISIKLLFIEHWHKKSYQKIIDDISTIIAPYNYQSDCINTRSKYSMVYEILEYIDRYLNNLAD